ncbi:hypothetical protein [Methylobacterium iners]|uniref:Uncharacterized protein n=1 Tax=Methylobacterium iners TaxID=418707 RepID=A0ABQ4RZH7_9HYPH|nr:hypothetical protein [Methylobacterium iners]GJD94920.1 hypothetical protein OCOJLMKI_2127 [Methylobacterium iners]
MLRIALAASITFAASAAQAQRPSTVDMSCRQARATVSQQGGVVLGTGGATYDRFVRDRGFCEATEITTRAFVPTRDEPGCFIGYRCKEPGRGDRFGNF